MFSTIELIRDLAKDVTKEAKEAREKAAITTSRNLFARASKVTCYSEEPEANSDVESKELEKSASSGDRR